jgi:hypothetical protein
LIDLKTRAVAPFSPDARTFHNIYALQKHVLLRHQSYHAYVESEVKLFACKEINGEKWYDKLFNVKYLPLFHHFKAIYQFPKHIIVLVKIVAKIVSFAA